MIVLYLIYNEFDERVRLVNADSPENAIAKVKATITSDELVAKNERGFKSLTTCKKILEMLESWDGRDVSREERSLEIDPESAREWTLDDYVWEVRQVIDSNAEITILEDVLF